MYQSKLEGRNTFSPFLTKWCRRAIIARVDLEKRTSLTPIKHQQFQTTLSNASDCNGSYFRLAEALIRWQHPERGIIAGQCILFLGRRPTGLILPIGQWVLDTVCAQNSIHGNMDPLTVQYCALQVNVSAKLPIKSSWLCLSKSLLPLKTFMAPTRRGLKLELTEKHAGWTNINGHHC